MENDVASAPDAAPAQAGRLPSRAASAAVAALLALAAVAAFANSLGGEFVYDDRTQIVGNRLIQDPELFWTALGSDVHAFKERTAEASRDRWRPVFVAWLIANERLWGVEDPTGWHAANLALHAVAVVLAWLVLVGLGLGRAPAAAAALLFAVHPVHAESVAWISGSPDLLVAVGTLGALLLVLRLLRRPSAAAWAGALALHGLALGSKEIAILFPAVAFAVAATRRDAQGPRAALRSGLLHALPFVGTGVGYLVARALVLESDAIVPAAGPGFGSVLLNLPAVLAFYLRQGFAPFQVAPLHPLRLRSVEELAAGDLLGQCLLVAVALAAGLVLARRSRAVLVGLVLFAAYLAPALNLGAFDPERIVQDRYLYLPVLGVVVALVVAVRELAGRLPERSRPLAGPALAVLALAAAAALTARTLRENRVWHDEVALWRAGVASDPGSSFGWSQLGYALKAREEIGPAMEAFDRSVAIRPSLPALVGRADLNVRLERWPEVEADSRAVLARQPGDDRALERLALSMQRRGRLPEAAAALEEAIRTTPFRRCDLTQMLAVVLYLGGRKQQALERLEEVRPAVSAEPTPRAKLVLVRLGDLYREQGRFGEARRAFEDYLAETEGDSDPATLRQRASVERTLTALPR